MDRMRVMPARVAGIHVCLPPAVPLHAGEVRGSKLREQA
jgi:hypothetical protein